MCFSSMFIFIQITIDIFISNEKFRSRTRFEIEVKDDLRNSYSNVLGNLSEANLAQFSCKTKRWVKGSGWFTL